MKKLISAALIAASATTATAAEMPLTPKLVGVVKDAVASFGMVCPEVSSLFYEGIAARGDVIIVRCSVPGQVDRIEYRLTITPQDTAIVEPME